VTHLSSPNLVESWTADPNGMPRPREIKATIGGVEVESTGVYTFDGSGNIASIGVMRYTYDAFNRLTEWGTATNGEGSRTARTYDRYGNYTGMSSSSCGPEVSGRRNCLRSSSLLLNPEPLTNHYPDLQYADRGNVTAMGGSPYTYDALNMITRTVSGERDYRFLYGPGDERVAIRPLVVERRLLRSALVPRRKQPGW
jgi:hypothetical protein